MFVSVASVRRPPVLRPRGPATLAVTPERRVAMRCPVSLVIRSGHRPAVRHSAMVGPSGVATGIPGLKAPSVRYLTSPWSTTEVSHLACSRTALSGRPRLWLGRGGEWTWRGLNSRPSPCHGAALPLRHTSVVDGGSVPDRTGPCRVSADRSAVRASEPWSRSRVPPSRASGTGRRRLAGAPASGADDGARTRFLLLGGQVSRQWDLIRVERPPGVEPGPSPWQGDVVAG